MLRALEMGTAGLKAPTGEVVDSPTNTSDALMSGGADAIAGAVERMHRKLEAGTGAEPELMMSGGAAVKLASITDLQVEMVDTLIFEACCSCRRNASRSSGAGLQKDIDHGGRDDVGYTAEMQWGRGDASREDFVASRYSRRHRLRFDGGAEVPARRRRRSCRCRFRRRGRSIRKRRSSPPSRVATCSGSSWPRRAVLRRPLSRCRHRRHGRRMRRAASR